MLGTDIASSRKVAFLGRPPIVLVVPETWLVLAAGDDRQHGGNDGYEDAPSTTYRWDNTVPHHGDVRPGDVIAVWDKRWLIGVSVVEAIDEGEATKIVRRCSRCGGSHIKRRKTKVPPWRCFGCNENFDVASSEEKAVHTYASRHGEGWIELEGVLDGPQLRALCRSPRSQLSIRPLDWAAFVQAVRDAAPDVRLTVVEDRAERLRGGHSRANVRVRLGQMAFRRALIARYGQSCAFTGPAPLYVLEAGHLYSYAEVGEHDAFGGLLLRRDVHRLFDLGLIAVDPDSLTVDVDDQLSEYPQYAALHGQPLKLELSARHLAWLRDHWVEHRAAGA